MAHCGGREQRGPDELAVPLGRVMAGVVLPSSGGVFIDSEHGIESLA
jgi:hypothetical protein